jgi:hypothetical protein
MFGFKGGRGEEYVLCCLLYGFDWYGGFFKKSAAIIYHHH